MLQIHSFKVHIYPEKATKFFKIFPLILTACTVVKSKVEVSQNFVVFSEYMNFKKVVKYLPAPSGNGLSSRYQVNVVLGFESLAVQASCEKLKCY